MELPEIALTPMTAYCSLNAYNLQGKTFIAFSNNNIHTKLFFTHTSTKSIVEIN